MISGTPHHRHHHPKDRHHQTSVWSGKPVIVTWKRCKSAPETFRESPLRSLLWPSPFLHHCRHHHHHHHHLYHHHHFDLNSTIAILILTLTFSTSNIIFPYAASHHESLKYTWAVSLQVICWPRKVQNIKGAWKQQERPIICMIVWGARPLYLVYPPCPNYGRTHFCINFAKLRSTCCRENQKPDLYVEKSAVDDRSFLFFSLS